MTISLPRSAAEKTTPLLWYAATWQDYIALRDAPRDDASQGRMRLDFDQDRMRVSMGGEGINHAKYSDLFTTMLFLWAIQHPDQVFDSIGRCLIEQPETQACAPDLVLYVGADSLQRKEGEPRKIDLARCRVPDLVGEISDTTLASDLDEQKHLYEALSIPEYWVVDTQGKRVFAFQLQDGKYYLIEQSNVLAGLTISLLNEAIDRMVKGTNTTAAAWFSGAIQELSNPS